MTQEETTTTAAADVVAAKGLKSPAKENGSRKATSTPSELREDAVDTAKAGIATLEKPLAADENDAVDVPIAAGGGAQPEAGEEGDEPAAEPNGDATVTAEQDAPAVAADVQEVDQKLAVEAAPEPTSEPAPEPTSEAAPATAPKPSAEPVVASAPEPIPEAAPEPAPEAPRDPAPEASPSAGPGPATAAEGESAAEVVAAAAVVGSASKIDDAADVVGKPVAKDEEAEQQKEGAGEDEAGQGSEPAAEQLKEVEGSEGGQLKVVAEQNGEPKAHGGQASAPSPRAVAATAAAGTDAVDALSPNDASMVTPPGTVQALSRRLSSNSLPGQITPTRSMSGEKPPASIGGAASAGGASVAGGRLTKSPSLSRSGEASPMSTHDTKNTINVSQLIKLGAFKMMPLKDFVPYDELLRLRLEDGIDATRKEDYLNEADFKEVFGLDRDAFRKQPAWRQSQAKKKANLF